MSASQEIIGLKFVPVQLQDENNNVPEAVRAECPVCGGFRFELLIINGRDHIFCPGCGEFYAKPDIPDNIQN